MSNPLTLRVPRRLSAFPEITAAFDAFLRREQVGPRPSYVAHLAAEEIVRNLVEHGRSQGSGWLEVSLGLEPAHLVVTIEDDGEAFDPRDAPAPALDVPFEERSHRGMGLHLVRTMVDEIGYERYGGRNRLRLAIRR